MAPYQNYLVSSSSPKGMRTGCLLFPVKGMQNTGQPKTAVSPIFAIKIFALSSLPHNQSALRPFYHKIINSYNSQKSSRMLVIDSLANLDMTACSLKPSLPNLSCSVRSWRQKKHQTSPIPPCKREFYVIPDE